MNNEYKVYKTIEISIKRKCKYAQDCGGFYNSQKCDDKNYQKGCGNISLIETKLLEKAGENA